MTILAIETSCDETSVAIVKKNKKEKKASVLSMSTASSIILHRKTGGIIPEEAARQQVKYIIPVLVNTLLNYKKKNNPYFEQENDRIKIDPEDFKKANKILKQEIDAIAVTVGPGLIGSLLVGVETAKTFSYAFNKPLIPVNHLLSHIFANFADKFDLKERKAQQIKFPFIGLIASGGHTDLLIFKSFKNFNWLGGTRDDAAGEAMDKIGRLLGIKYPAGPDIEKMAQKISRSSVLFKSPMINTKNYDFSFSGLKTEALRFIQKQKSVSEELKNEICFAVQKAVFNVLIKKTLNAAKKYGAKSILLGGGVASNENLKKGFEIEIKNCKLNVNLFFPEKIFCTDNAGMTGAYALFNFKPVNWQKVKADPELYFYTK